MIRIVEIRTEVFQVVDPTVSIVGNAHVLFEGCFEEALAIARKVRR